LQAATILSMKKILFAVLAFAFGITSGASQNSDNARVSGSTYINPATKKDAPKGSPYNQTAFARAKVLAVNVDAYLRYNVYADEFEFISPKNDTLILDKIDDYASIHFSGLNRKYILVPYTEGKKLVYGYLIDVYQKNGYGLLKRENIGFTEAKVAKTTLETAMPAKYNKLSDSHFFKNKEAGIVSFPDSKKALIKLFPDKKDAIETFVKDNKIDFDQQADLIKVVDFLAAQ
jgi:hypothetical protein